MKYLLALLLLTTSAFSADKILGYKSYKLGKKIRGETQSSTDFAHIQVKKSTDKFVLVLVGGPDKLCTSVRVQFKFKRSYQNKNTTREYYKILAKAIKKYGKGQHRRDITFKDAEYVILQPEHRRSLRLILRGSRVEVMYDVMTEEAAAEALKKAPENINDAMEAL